MVTDLDELQGCDIVVEAIAEDTQVKCDIHRKLGELLPEDTMLATTTSSLSVAELAQASGRAGPLRGAARLQPGRQDEAGRAVLPGRGDRRHELELHRLCERLEKTAVEVPDAAGFVVNKLLFPYLFDAVRLLERNGIDPQSIDTCMKLGAGHPMGPLALLDFVGLDVAVAIGESIGAEVPDRVRELIAEGKLGRKAGAGFYDYG